VYKNGLFNDNKDRDNPASVLKKGKTVLKAPFRAQEKDFDLSLLQKQGTRKS